jgi:hypothetical protein
MVNDKSKYDRSLVLLKLLHALTVDSDKARAYIGSPDGGAIQPLVAFSLTLPSSSSQPSPLAAASSLPAGTKTTAHEDLQIIAALILAALASCNSSCAACLAQSHVVIID